MGVGWDLEELLTRIPWGLEGPRWPVPVGSLPADLLLAEAQREARSRTKEPLLSFQNDLYWDDWSQLSIFRAPKQGGSPVALLASQLPGLMDMKVFYKGKTAGKGVSSLISLVGLKKGWGRQPPPSSSAASASLSGRHSVTSSHRHCDSILMRRRSWERHALPAEGWWLVGK